MKPAKQTELEQFLDQRLEVVVNEAKLHFRAMEKTVFSGSVTGFLIKTGIALAVREGVRRETLTGVLELTMDDFYG